MIEIERPDISHYLAHFTKNKWPFGHKDANNPTNNYKNLSAEKRLINILTSKKIHASQLPWCGSHKAVCLTECPWTSLIGHSKVYSPFGIGFSKEFIFSKNGGPVFYLRADFFRNQHWESQLMPFITPFWPKYAPKGTRPLPKTSHLDYSHEREWRVVGDLNFEYSDIAFVVLQDYKAMARFPQELKDAIGREKFLLLDNYRKIEELWPVHKL